MLSRPIITHYLCIIFTIFGRVRVVHLVVMACVLRATTKKGRQLFSGYGYEFAHPWKKSGMCHEYEAKFVNRTIKSSTKDGSS